MLDILTVAVEVALGLNQVSPSFKKAANKPAFTLCFDIDWSDTTGPAIGFTHLVMDGAAATWSTIR